MEDLYSSPLAGKASPLELWRVRLAKASRAKSSQTPCYPLTPRRAQAMLSPREGYHQAADIAAVNTLTA